MNIPYPTHDEVKPMAGKSLRGLKWLVLAGLLIASSSWAQPGNPDRGEALYVGSTALAAGGAPCLACHGVAGHKLGQAGGASYGPDLTGLFADYGEEGVAAILEDPAAFESMTAIFTDRSLTEEEIADLTAFFASLSDQEQLETGPGFAMHVVLATILLLVLFGALGWRRLQGVREPLVTRARFGKGESA